MPKNNLILSLNWVVGFDILAFALMLKSGYEAINSGILWFTFLIIVQAAFIYKTTSSRAKLLMVVLSLGLICPILIAYADGCYVSSSAMYRILAWNIAILGLLYVLINYKVSSNENIQTACTACTMIFSLIVTFPFLAYFFISGKLINQDIALALFQTDISELIEYVISQKIVLSAFLVVGLLVVYLSFKFSNDLPRQKINYRYLISFSLVSVVLFSYGCVSSKNLYLTYLYNAKDTLVEYENFAQMTEIRKNNLLRLSGQGKELSKRLRKGNYYLIIGESQNKDHMSVYGYNRETTPWLNTKRDDRRFVFFENAYASYPHTVQALTFALTKKNQYNKIALEKSPSILELFNLAGGDTYWLSNQSKYGAYATPISAISDVAKYQVWLHQTDSYHHKYDEELVKKLKKIKLSPDKSNLVVIHLIGNHGTYRDRYPEAFVRFGKQSHIDEYDNSVFYTDHVMEELFDIINKDQHFNCLIYMSDHGESVEEGIGHDASRFNFKMVRIPFIVAFSDKFSKQYHGIVSAVNRNNTKVFSNDLLFDLFVGLAGLNEIEGGNLDLSGEFKLKAENVKTLYGAISVTKDSESFQQKMKE